MYLSRWTLHLGLLISLWLLPQISHAQFPKYLTDFYRAKQEAKTKTRWTLADWLEQKKSVALMNQWLALNRSANVFEFLMGGGISRYEIKNLADSSLDLEDQEASYAQVGLLVTIFGLGAEYEKLEDDSEVRTGLFYLRLLGTAEQNTNFTLHYGVRQWREIASNSEFENPVAGAALTLYLFKHFGIRGMYRQFMEDEADTGKKLEGSKTQAGLFVEALFMRVSAHWYKEPVTISTAAGVKTDYERQGVEVGLNFYF